MHLSILMNFLNTNYTSIISISDFDHQMLSMSEVSKVILTFDTSDMLQHT